MKNSPNRPIRDFELFDNGTRCFCLCFEITVVTKTSLADAARGYNHLYECFCSRFGRQLKLWRTNVMKAMKAVSDRTLDMFPFWLQDERALSEDLLGLTMHSGPEPVSVDPPSFDFFYIQTDPEKERGGVRMALPLEIAERDPDAVVSFVADAVADLPLAYGFAGYSLSWDPNGYRMLERAETWAVPLLKRHPGLGLGDLLPYVFHAHHGVLAVNWLTLLGTQYTDVLGGFPVIARSLGGEYALVSLGNGGTLIRAGDIPLLGDVNRANRLQHYQKVGRALRPVWVPDDIVENINILIMRGEDKIKWINRFS